MKTPDPYAPCPMCGEPQRLRREGDVWRPVQHTRRYTAASLYRRRCEGGTLPHDAVLAAVRDQRAEKKACVARAEYERTKARAEYERAVKDIDRRAADNLAATVALDRLLAKLDAERPAPPPPKPEPRRASRRRALAAVRAAHRDGGSLRRGVDDAACGGAPVTPTAPRSRGSARCSTALTTQPMRSSD